MQSTKTLLTLDTHAQLTRECHTHEHAHTLSALSRQLTNQAAALHRSLNTLEHYIMHTLDDYMMHLTAKA